MRIKTSSTSPHGPIAFLIVLLILVFPGFPAFADTLTFSGDSATTYPSEENPRAVLIGHAHVRTEDTTIVADRIELYGKDDVLGPFVFAICAGNVHVVDTKRGIELTSDELFFDRKKKLSRIRGNAVMADLKNELVVKGGFIEDRDEEKLTLIQIGVRILKKDMVCRAEFARFDRANNTLELSGMPWVSRKGDEYRAARITVNTDTEEISLEGNVQGEITTKPQNPSTDGTQQGGTPASQAPAPQADTIQPGAAAKPQEGPTGGN
jgi:lipopolysaccharide export system protein LptA